MMKRISVLFLTGIIVLVLSGISFSGETYTYATDAFSEGSGGLDHYYAYSWDIDLTKDKYGNDFTKDQGDIVSVSLVFDNILENTGDGDILQISVLDSDDKVNYSRKYNVDDGIVGYKDKENPSNYFTVSNVVKDTDKDGKTAELLFTLGDISNNSGNKITVTYNSDESSNITRVGDQFVPWNQISSNVIADLTNYISGTILTLGLDPDCHYYASSISLILNTSDTLGGISHAPEPETLVLFGLGLLGASAFGRKRFS
ncbi:MAG: PEP-CTERM sorting domain-containing protein [Desulfobacter postgatei]|uniref:PEP-CTERM sorting domain-containing protein n=1 Tax=Desulfobacter postgatei TaxID=2293 RepID=UPI0023F071B6|nr:PEP-CTERM sorting domain-containing protein [Desulfobacter postgatei]MDD4273110.1 PEP-CTERM sorting domain-containing protein [Desulfobacter postgatei]